MSTKEQASVIGRAVLDYGGNPALFVSSAPGVKSGFGDSVDGGTAPKDKRTLAPPINGSNALRRAFCPDAQHRENAGPRLNRAFREFGGYLGIRHATCDVATGKMRLAGEGADLCDGPRPVIDCRFVDYHVRCNFLSCFEKLATVETPAVHHCPSSDVVRPRHWENMNKFAAVYQSERTGMETAPERSRAQPSARRVYEVRRAKSPSYFTTSPHGRGYPMSMRPPILPPGSSGARRSG